MARQLIQMTREVFEELKSGVQESHKEYIADVERRIKINESYRDKCCDFLKKAKIVGLNKKYEVAIVFIKYEDRVYIGIDSRYADEFESVGYVIVEREEIVIGSQLLCVAEGFCQLKANSAKLIDNCLGLKPEDDKKYIEFSPEDILELTYGVSIFENGENELRLSIEAQDDLKRLFLLIETGKNIELSTEYKEALSKLASMTVTRKICNNLVDFIIIGDDRIRFLTLYQCIEYLFIPCRASEFKSKYNMNISDALRLHIDETRRNSERENSLAVLKSYARMPIIEKLYLHLLGEEGDENKLEKVNNWIYELRCNIAHFRYGQVKNNDTYEWNHIFALMLELLVSIYSNLDQNVQDICNGVVVVSR